MQPDITAGRELEPYYREMYLCAHAQEVGLQQRLTH
jgi:hypothetical protein